MIRWKRVTGSVLGAVTTEVDGIGHYLIRRRAKGERRWVVLLNGQEINDVWPTATAARRDIEAEIQRLSA